LAKINTQMPLSYSDKLCSELKNEYGFAQPFPHIVIDNFLTDAEANELLLNFPNNSENKHWIHYKHYNENKLGLNTRENLPSSILEFIDKMNAKSTLLALEKITGINNLVADETLEGAGIHSAGRGGFLNIHADFATHPKNKKLLRCVNAILYLNKNWDENYNGNLEFWNKEMTHCEASIAPLFNRLVVFNTNQFSFHGFPKPLQCPAGETRKSIAIYYYIETTASEKIVSTHYHVLPGKGFTTKVINWLDNKLLLVYTSAKRYFNINDEFFSRFLRK